MRASSAPVLLLVAVTAVWGLTFVQVQDALALYPLFAFLAVRFAISVVVLAPFAFGPIRDLPRDGIVAGLAVGLLLAAAYGFQTAGLELTTVSSTGFITGLYVVFTPFIALALFRTPVPRTLVGRRRLCGRRAAAPERRPGRAPPSATRSCSRALSPRRSRSSRWNGSHRATTRARSPASR